MDLNYIKKLIIIIAIAQVSVTALIFSILFEVYLYRKDVGISYYKRVESKLNSLETDLKIDRMKRQYEKRSVEAE